MVAHCGGMRPLAAGESVGRLRDGGHAVQVVVAPVRSVDRVGEQSAVVCHCV